MKFDQSHATGALKSATGSDSTSTAFRIPNMDCRHEEAAIRARLAEVPEVRSLAFDLPQRRLTIEHSLATPQSLLSALTEIGMEAALEVAVAAPSSCGSSACSSGGCGATPVPSTDVFTIPNMDCRNEEAAIREKLGVLPDVSTLAFDLPARRLSVQHTLPSAQPILEHLHAIGMHARLADQAEAAAPACDVQAGCGPCGKPEPSFAPAASGNTTQFVITNMDCPTEEALIRKHLAKVTGVDRLEFNLIHRRLGVQHRLGDPAPILDALREIGMQATVEREAGSSPNGQAVYLIEKMDCPTEEALLRKALENMPGVSALHFDLIGRRLTVSHTLPDQAPIAAAIERLGMSPVLQDSHRPAPAVTSEFGTGISKARWARMAAAGVLAIGAEVMAFSGLGESSLPVVSAALAAIALGGLETLKKGWIALRTLSLNMNLLMTIAVIGAALIGQWPEAAVVIWLFGIAEMIEALSLDRARNAIRKLMDLAPETALVRQADGRWEEVQAESVPLGAMVRVRPGERIALDGVVASGASSVNQAPITGESMPVEKKSGDTVFAGTINERGTLEFEVRSRKGETTLDRIARSVQEAQGQRAPTQRFVDRFASVYTPAVFALAMAIAVIPPLFFGGAWFDWAYKALVMLVIACPCALVISTPVTVVSGLAAAARRGILVKGGLYLEQGRLLRAVALDKTGTLTHGRPALTDTVPLASLTQAQVLRIAASLDALSEHPVATAIVAGYGNEPHAPVQNFEALAGRGVKGDIDGQRYYIGNQRLAVELGVASEAVRALLDKLESQAKTAVVLATDQQALAVLAVADTVRDSSKEAIAQLKRLGVEPVMLTGDNRKTAEAVAAQVGITDARGDLLPHDKLAAIEKLAAQGPVGMVGDGVNDAPALAKSNIGFAMGAAGTDTAIETADVALMQDDLRKLPEFIAMSRRVGGVLKANIAFAIGTKAIFMGLAFAGYASLWMAILADMGASLVVVFNGLRLLGRPAPRDGDHAG
ncbi:heavy metal translocating P-type ATPase [Piscinibacter gummiphilus]|uniref:P-type Zn(2+) transporter n=1 Tax=Piscinibacter gummiphilus TaxID=946333 RepID=A0ABZ0D1A5_9BURK|nr:heavy metal translocating P-type ATPase [Piscinibacter gummiphilus]WOB10952.1 heavy metal translocating P-type ATPase [Piscinibacter gummiphilus]